MLLKKVKHSTRALQSTPFQNPGGLQILSLYYGSRVCQKGVPVITQTGFARLLQDMSQLLLLEPVLQFRDFWHLSPTDVSFILKVFTPKPSWLGLRENLSARLWDQKIQMEESSDFCRASRLDLKKALCVKAANPLFTKTSRPVSSCSKSTSHATSLRPTMATWFRVQVSNLRGVLEPGGLEAFLSKPFSCVWKTTQFYMLRFIHVLASIYCWREAYS